MHIESQHSPVDPSAMERLYTDPFEFAKLKIGAKKISDDITVDLNQFKKINPRLGDRDAVLKAINNGQYEKMREISDFFYKTSGIYSRLCRYMAFMYRYDWLITPYIEEGFGAVSSSDLKQTAQDQYLKTFFSALHYLDDFRIKQFCGEVALKVVRFGSYYGYLIVRNGKVVVQQLSPKYCRSRYYDGNRRPIVEFNMKYFDDMYPDTQLRERVLKTYPKDFQKGYRLYKQNRLAGDFQGDDRGWYLLEIGSAIKFSLNDEDYPPFISVIPAIIDLAEAKEIDKQRMEQKIIKLIIQKMPIDKNGDLIFDVEQARELHNNAVQMLGRALGIKVLTTFADASVEDLDDDSTTATSDELEKVERGVYNEAGVSQLQFNSDGNIALNYSTLNDEASMYDLLLQFEDFINLLLTPYNRKPKKCFFRAQMLTTTIYNYKELAKQFKELTTLGYSKMLPAIAMGQSQSSILTNAYFENNMLDLNEVFVPPMSSNTMSAKALEQTGKAGGANNATKQQTAQAASDNKGGRPEKEDSQKTEKTIQNKESGGSTK